jgi:hypothetical protein
MSPCNYLTIRCQWINKQFYQVTFCVSKETQVERRQRVGQRYHVENAMIAKSHSRIRMKPRGSCKTRVSITVVPIG